jgi:hypothetical protein
LLIGGSAAFLIYSMRGLGPSGPGVPAMLRMQDSWRSAPAIHASGVITETPTAAGTSSRTSPGSVSKESAAATVTRFQYWRNGVGDRRVELDAATGRTLFVVDSENAWKTTADIVEPLDPARVSLFPLSDPDSDTTFYRWARRWTPGPARVIDGMHVTEVLGVAAGWRLTFDLNRVTHLPRRVLLQETTGAVPRRWVVDYLRVELPASLPTSLFKKPAESGVREAAPSASGSEPNSRTEPAGARTASRRESVALHSAARTSAPG